MQYSDGIIEESSALNVHFDFWVSYILSKHSTEGENAKAEVPCAVWGA